MGSSLSCGFYSGPTPWWCSQRFAFYWFLDWTGSRHHHDKAIRNMALEVETKDCNALSDSEISEMADLCAESPLPYEVGDLSKQAEEWVLCCEAQDGGRLKGFAYYTLERIGGTPAIIIGLGSIARSSRRDAVMRAMITDLMHLSLIHI